MHVFTELIFFTQKTIYYMFVKNISLISTPKNHFFLLCASGSVACEEIPLSSHIKATPIRAPERCAMWLTFCRADPPRMPPANPVEAWAASITWYTQCQREQRSSSFHKKFKLKLGTNKQHSLNLSSSLEVVGLPDTKRALSVNPWVLKKNKFCW